MTISLFYKFLIVTCFAVNGAPFTIPSARQSQNHWNYENPATWKEHFVSCGGAHQSPINLDSNEATTTNIPEFVFNNYDKILPEMVSNNGHTVMLQLLEANSTKNIFPYITSGGLNERYNFYQLHFHWGKDSIRGSEHHINGQPYPAELHMVHYNTKYGSFNQALPHPDGLAVLGIMIELQKWDNTAFRHIEQFDSILNPNENKSHFLHYSVPLSDLLPDSTRSFYRYNGSLTTPKCDEDVIWTIFDTPIAISLRQLDMLRRLTDERGRPLENNYRPVQELHGRTLLYRSDSKMSLWNELQSVEALLARQKQLRKQLGLSTMDDDDSTENQ